MKHIACIVLLLTVMVPCFAQQRLQRAGIPVTRPETIPHTIHRTQNTYVLSDQDKGAIFDSIAVQKETTALLHALVTRKDTTIFTKQHYVRFFSLLNSAHITAQDKQTLLTARMAYDKTRPVPMGTFLYGTVCGGGGSGRYIENSYGLTTQAPTVVNTTIYSREKAVADFLATVTPPEMDLSRAYFYFIQIDNNTTEPLMKRGLKLDIISKSSKIKRKLRKVNIVNTAINHFGYNETQRNGVIARHDVITVYYTE